MVLAYFNIVYIWEKRYLGTSVLSKTCLHGVKILSQSKHHFKWHRIHSTSLHLLLPTTFGRPCWSDIAVCHGLAVFSELSNMRTPSPAWGWRVEVASCSLPNLIWRISLGLDALTQSHAEAYPDALMVIRLVLGSL